MPDAPESSADERKPGQIIARNTVFGLGAQFVLRVASFIFTIAVVRTLGDENFGQYSIILAWAGLFSVIGDLGINQYLAREIARNKDIANQLFWDTVVLRLFLAVAAMIVTVGGALTLTDYSTDIVVGIAIYTSTYFLQALMAPLDSLLRGNERVDLTSVLEVVNQILFMVLAGFFLFLGFNFIWLVIASLIITPAQIVLAYRFIRRNHIGIPRFRINSRLWFSVIKAGLPFATTQLAMSFAFQVDTIFLSTYTTNEVVGWYNAGYRLTLALVALSTAFFRALQPTMAREHTSNPDAVRSWYHTSARLMLMFTVPLAVGASILSNQIVLIYGAEYSAASLAFALLIWDLPFVTYHALCGYLATAIRREANAARIHVTIGLSNVILNFLLVPQFGLIGACFATVLTDLMGAALFYTLFRHEIGGGLRFFRMIRMLMAAIIMGFTAVVLINVTTIFVIVPVAGLIYAGLVWFTGALTVEEQSHIKQLAYRVAGLFST